jgi:hypothetical protein
MKLTAGKMPLTASSDLSEYNVQSTFERAITKLQTKFDEIVNTRPYSADFKGCGVQPGAVISPERRPTAAPGSQRRCPFP